MVANAVFVDVFAFFICNFNRNYVMIFSSSCECFCDIKMKCFQCGRVGDWQVVDRFLAAFG